VGEMLKEIQQARRQRFRNVYPRVPRTAAYVALRAVTNVLLRDLNVSLIAEQMSRGAPVIYCDFVDYDEVAHHAGPLRPESLQTLEGLDRVLGTLHKLAGVAARDYRIVVLSDHGQSQGATFSQRYGLTIERLVADLAGDRAERDGDGAEPVTAGPEDEDWGRANTLLAGVSHQTRSCGPLTVGPRGEVVTIVSGNLAMLYLTGVPGRADLEAVEALRPGLVGGLAKHPGIGFVVAATPDGPVAIGPAGRHHLRDGRVEGDDPLLPYGPAAAADLLEHQGVAHVGDLVVVSRIDAGTEEVAAFEELVGSHGGIGGWQTEAILVHPAEWPMPGGALRGPVAVHERLVAWLDELGLRAPAPEEEPLRDKDLPLSARVRGV